MKVYIICSGGLGDLYKNRNECAVAVRLSKDEANACFEVEDKYNDWAEIYEFDCDVSKANRIK